MVEETFVYAKLMLFGEYSLLFGSRALTLPFLEKKAALRSTDPLMAPQVLKNAENSNRQLASFHRFLILHKDKEEGWGGLDLDAMHKDLRDGLYLWSDIPSGYGLGSSGALVAAIYRRYGPGPVPGSPAEISPGRLSFLKGLLGRMEAFFHGSSSGIDPLSCYLGAPLTIDPAAGPSLVRLKKPATKENQSFFLVDTGKARHTAPLVRSFQRRYCQPDFRRMLHESYIPCTEKCIEAMTSASTTPGPHIRELSLLQLRHFTPMIPPEFIRIWERGLGTGSYSLKLCGAGGGGYLLGHTTHAGLLPPGIQSAIAVDLSPFTGC